MVPVEGTEKELPCELVLIAAGFLGTQKYVTDAFGVELTERTNIKTEEGKFATNAAGVFTAGDCHTGQSLVVKAIRQGRDCAREQHRGCRFDKKWRHFWINNIKICWGVEIK